MSAETLHVISLFSGIGGIDLAFERAGMTTALLCERDKHATAVLNHHWPHIPVHPDVSELTPDDLRDAAPDPDRAILAAGFPCQPFSTAGKRGGERDPRGTLFYDVIRLVRGYRPAWIVLENVPGLLSIDGGETARTILDLLNEEGYLVDIDILDAQRFGVPQRRKRVVILCHRADLGLSGKTTYSAINIATLLTESLLIVLAEARRQSSVDAPSWGSSKWLSADGLKKRMRLLSPELNPDDLTTLLASSADCLAKSAQERGGSGLNSESPGGSSTETGTSSSGSPTRGGSSWSTARSWREASDVLCETVRSSTTSTPSRPTTASQISTYAQALLTIARLTPRWTASCSDSTETCPNYWKAAESTSTALREYIDYARQTGNSLLGGLDWTYDWDAFVREAEREIQSLGRLGDSGAAPAQVLLEPEGSGGDSAQSHPTRPATPTEAARGADETGRIAYALTEAHGLGSDPAVSGTLGAHATGGWGGDDIDRTGAFVSHTYQKVVRSGARDADGNLPAEVWAERRGDATLSPYDLGSETRACELVVQPLAIRGREGGAELEIGPEGGPYNALRAGDGGSSRQSLVAITVTGDRTHALTAEGHDASEDGTGRGTPVVAYQQQGSNVGEMGTLRAGNGSHTGGVPFVAFQPDAGGDTAMSIGETAPCLSVGQKAAVMGETVVRRLTPLECTRLQGLPDGWVDVPGNSESQQYKQLGNGVAVPVFEWVGRRIVAVDARLRAASLAGAS